MRLGAIEHGGFLRAFSFARSGVLGMSRGSTPRHAQTAGDLGFAVQFNAETPWHFAQSNNSKDNSLWVTPFIPCERPDVKHAIADYLRLPQPTPAPALMRELH